ncbi:GNAT family N-acetyltransferase [Dyella telluris]|uniref:GNAT family N-acetyltransferase n=1 Tax=Dyella telluris TaxID=2763498 RepID=A0A7G8Q972_9GAMM|nr:GNAT family N-acetyltransferase [Dyella telluris]QNK03330.1 GNAT family N-acetyltransferase [Dyella telluris]
MRAGPAIRRATGIDVPALLSLGAEHAAFEQLHHRASQRPAALAGALDSDPPRLHAWLALQDDNAVGYASATLDYATLDGADYLHMDCLYVREAWRGQAIGLGLWHAIREFAQVRRCAAIQWQTPSWNVHAARFYRRLGAAETAKLRYCLPLPGDVNDSGA